MTRQMQLVILTPEKKLLDISHASFINLSLTDGGTIGILPGHAPLIAQNIAGTLLYRDEAGDHELEIQPGILHIDREKVTILTSGLIQPTHQSVGSQDIVYDRLVEALNVHLDSKPQSRGVGDA